MTVCALIVLVITTARTSRASGEKCGENGGTACNAAAAHAEDEHDSHGDEHAGLVELDWATAAAEGVTFATAAPGSIGETIALNGEVSLNGDSIVHVAPRFPGVVKRVEKNLGDEVTAGDLLAVVQSNESLTTYEIRAEVPGTIIEKDATRGEFVRDDKNLFTIADLARVWVNAAVYPEQLKKIKIGTPVLVSSRWSEATARGSISYLRSSLSEITRTALARTILVNEKREWIPGMFVRVSALFDPSPAGITVPTSALQQIENEPAVFVKTKSPDNMEAFQVRRITPGRSDAGTTEVLAGLKAGEVVASGNTYIVKAELGKGSAAHED